MKCEACGKEIDRCDNCGTELVSSGYICITNSVRHLHSKRCADEWAGTEKKTSH